MPNNLKGTLYKTMIRPVLIIWSRGLDRDMERGRVTGENINQNAAVDT